jgi:glycosyltransferase involved in cell wall biosynthesis
VAERIAPGVRVEALTNGVDTSLFRRVAPSLPPPVTGRRRIAVPRRLFQKNGVEYLVRALPEIGRRVDVEAVIIGDGPERGTLERLAADLGISDRITFLGARPHADMPGLLSSAEIAVFPSLMEATSVAALESMACGLPVAASRVGGLPEIVDEGVGILFEPANPASLADGVVKLLESPRLRELGNAARERVTARWTNERLVDRHVAIYEHLVARRRAA